MVTLKVNLDLDLESYARDLHLSHLQYLLAQDRLGDEDEDLGLENPFPTVTQVEVAETPVDLLTKQVKRVVDGQVQK